MLWGVDVLPHPADSIGASFGGDDRQHFGYVYAGIAAALPTQYEDLDGIWEFTGINWGATDQFKVEASMKNLSGDTCYVRLYDITDGVVVPNSTIELNTGSRTLVRSADLRSELLSGNKYKLQKSLTGFDGRGQAKLVRYPPT
jgi:hypothetical protein